LSLAAQAGQRRVTVEPDVFQFVFGHMRGRIVTGIFGGLDPNASRW
jgi:hypothetical protein